MVHNQSPFVLTSDSSLCEELRKCMGECECGYLNIKMDVKSEAIRYLPVQCYEWE